MLDGSQPITVLHVDDVPELTEITKQFLEREHDSLTVETATSAVDGLERLDDDVDCIISDYDMPEMTGIEFLEAVRETHPELPFVLFTGKGSEEIAADAVSAGATDYIQKETGTDQYALLANRVKHAVAGYRSRQRAERHERINALIREVNRKLVAADTVEEVERAVCETLTDSDSYRFAWIGAPDDGVVVPRTCAGDAESYLEEVTVRCDDTPEGRGPGGRAVRTRETQLAQNIPADSSFEPWRDVPARYGYESVIVLPLEHEGTLHGILPLYADHPYAFDEMERTVLEELAETTSERLSAVKTWNRLLERERELARYETTLEALGDPVYATDAEGRFSYVNDAFVEMVGYDRETILGSRPDLIKSDEAVETAERNLGRILSADGPDDLTFEIDVLPKEGEPIPCEDHMGVPPFEGDRFEGSVGVLRDVSDRVRRERKLARKNERLESFASILSHDLRTPLTVAQGHLQLAGETGDAGHVDDAVDAVDRCQTLVGDILSLMREQSEATDTGPVALDELARESWESVAVGDATVSVETDRTVRTDERRLRRLLADLFDNCIEHGTAPPAPSAGHHADGAGTSDGVTVTVGDLDDGFYVADDGPGISDGERAEVFEESYTTSDRGTGYGVAIVQRVAETHGWTVTVTDSDAGGARFEVTGVDFA